MPFATQSGEALEDRVGETALVEEHAELGESLIFVVLLLAVAAWALWFVDRRSRATASGGSGVGAARGRSPVMLALMALSVVAALATTVQVVRIGHSGTASVWDGVGQQVVVDQGEDGDDD